MKPEQQRIAIAEALGWISLTGTPNDMLWPCDSYRTGVDGDMMKPPGVTHRHGAAPPDYLNDLNAMHEALSILTDTQWMRFLRLLVPRTDGTPDARWWLMKQAMTAPAAQVTEAFLRTIGKWAEE